MFPSASKIEAVSAATSNSSREPRSTSLPRIRTTGPSASKRSFAWSYTARSPETWESPSRIQNPFDRVCCSSNVPSMAPAQPSTCPGPDSSSTAKVKK